MSKLLHTSNTLACARPQITVFMYTTSYATVCLLMHVCQLHHFSCSSAGMLMFQPMACRSKPQVNRLHDWFSSFHAVQHTIRLCPCAHMFKTVSFNDADWPAIHFHSVFPFLPFCCCGEVWPASLRSCQTVGPVDCRVAERWSSGWQRRLSWKIRSRPLWIQHVVSISLFTTVSASAIFQAICY